MQEFECLGRAERLACRDTLMWGGWGIGTGKQALALSSHVISSQTGGLSELDRSFCCWNVLILFGRCTTGHNTMPAISYPSTCCPRSNFKVQLFWKNSILWRSFVSCICRAPKYAYFYVLTEKFRLQLVNTINCITLSTCKLPLSCLLEDIYLLLLMYDLGIL